MLHTFLADWYKFRWYAGQQYVNRQILGLGI